MANSPFLKDNATLVDEHLTDLDSEFTGCDRSVGGGCHILAVTESSAEWGLYKYLDWIAKQGFPDTCDDDMLDRHGRPRGVIRLTGESKAAYLERILERMRYAPASGNYYDWIAWIKECSYDHTTYVETVKDVFPFEHMRGMGSMNFAVTSNRTEAQGGEEIASAELLAAIVVKINTVRCWGDWDFMVIASSKKTQNVAINYSGPLDTAKAETDIIAYMKLLNVGKKLYRSQLEAIVINNGATDAAVTTPSADVAVTTGPLVYERIWPGTVTLSEV